MSKGNERKEDIGKGRNKLYSTTHNIFRMLTTFRICPPSKAISYTTNLYEAIRKIYYSGIRKLAGIQSPLVVTCGKLPGE